MPLIAAFISFALSALAPQQAPAQPTTPKIEQNTVRYQVVARGARLNRRVMGEIVDDVQGVPARPVDSLVYDGNGSTPIDDAIVILEVDPVTQQGLMRARWTDRNGSWEMYQDYFHHPDHLSGVRMGSSRDKVEESINAAIMQNVYLHGDTTAGTPIFPTLFAYIAAWGFTEVTRNGEPFLNKYGLPGPKRWISHIMVSEGVRQPDGTVRALGGEIYDPKRHKSVGAVEPNDLEFHLEFMDERFPMTPNRPAMFAFQYHLVFEDVLLRVTESQQPLSFAEADRLISQQSR